MQRDGTEVTAELFDTLGAIHTPTPLEEVRGGRASFKQLDNLKKALQAKQQQQTYKVATGVADKRLLSKQIIEQREAENGTI